MMNNSADMCRQQVESVLAQFSHPTLQKNLVALRAVRHCVVLDHTLYIELSLPFVWQQAFETLKSDTTETLKSLTQTRDVIWTLHTDIAALACANEQAPVKGVKNIIAISSGKGGVGKSSTAVNLALALAKEGAKVGILDADIYGPSIPMMLGTKDERPTSPDGEHMAPIKKFNIESNSIGYLVSDDNAMVWRGPMASKALMQLLQDTLWHELDYLVLDMPPGTGDIQLTLSQNIPVTGAVVITTPQDIALNDAMKGVVMFEKVNVPIIGVVENMSFHVCSQCGHHEAIFGTGGAEKMAKQKNIRLLGKLPLHITLREDLDNGTPTVAAQPDSELSQLYYQLAESISAQLYWQGKAIPAQIPIKTLS